jgi:hypothetical protein
VVLEETFFRLIIKMLPQKAKPEDYKWLEMGFFTRWTETTSLLICFDTPEDFPKKFQAALQTRHGGVSSTLKPYALQAVLMDLLVPLYDQSIWDLSVRIRTIEKVCLLDQFQLWYGTNRYLLPT